MSAPSRSPWAATPGGVMLSVRLTPKGGRDAIEQVETLADGSAVLKARVRAAPSEGAANEALIRLIAKAMGVPPRGVALTGGAASRIKRLRIAGDPPTLIAKLEKIAAAR